MRWTSTAVLMVVTIALFASPLQAKPDIGDPAPAFSLVGTDGRTYTLESIRETGRKGVVLAFFPKAFTPG